MLASLALHALVLFALPFLKEAKRQIPARLTARLAPKPPEPVPPRQEMPSPQLLPAPKSPAIRPAPVAKAVVPTAPAPILSVEPAKQASDPVFAVPAAPSVSAPSSSSGPTAKLESPPTASGLDPGTVARYRLELMDLARRYKKYPRIAQDNNWEGRVELRIAIGEDGAISSLSVTKGSGRVVLDDEAQAMIRTAKSKATIPPALRGKAFIIEIPVDFFLKEEK